ncbi:integrase catalytic domain-containing protein [Trichonephila clavipes]|nr:integrase catalytic domain-containing protein [Trichonephila clavipes]
MFSSIDRVTAGIRQRFQELQILTQKYAFLRPEVILSIDELKYSEGSHEVCGSPVVKVSVHDRYVMSSSPVQLKIRRVRKRCRLNLSRAQTSSRWCGVVARRGGASSGGESSRYATEDNHIADSFLLLQTRLSIGEFRPRNTIVEHHSDKAPNAARLLIQSKVDNISKIFSCMESLKIEYYEVLEEEKLSNLELIFDQMEEDLESIKGTVVHLRSYGENYTPTTKLLVSKSRVTPLKKISIPRLKLCFCHLLSQLINKVVNSLKLNIDKMLFSDSTIAIARTNSPPHQLKTFVANRVSNIQALTANYQWKHISSPDNPAHLISRGVNPSDLEDLEIWCSGSSSAMEEIIDDSCQNDLNSSEKELYLTELKKLRLLQT